LVANLFDVQTMLKLLVQSCNANLCDVQQSLSFSYIMCCQSP
jgi:hypothetical protein